MNKQTGCKVLVIGVGGLIGVMLVVCVLGGLVLSSVASSQTPSGLDSPGYYVRGGKVYFIAWMAGALLSDPKEMPDADAASFKILSTVYALDQAHAYFNGKPILSADPSSFKLIDTEHAKDKNHVYSENNVMSDDPAHFEFIPSSGPDNAPNNANNYARDSRFVYWLAEVIPGADPATFRVLNANSYCAVDAQHAYHAETVILNFNPRDIPMGRVVNDCTDTEIIFAP